MIPLEMMGQQTAGTQLLSRSVRHGSSGAALLYPTGDIRGRLSRSDSWVGWRSRLMMMISYIAVGVGSGWLGLLLILMMMPWGEINA